MVLDATPAVTVTGDVVKTNFVTCPPLTVRIPEADLTVGLGVLLSVPVTVKGKVPAGVVELVVIVSVEWSVPELVPVTNVGENVVETIPAGAVAGGGLPQANEKVTVLLPLPEKPTGISNCTDAPVPTVGVILAEPTGPIDWKFVASVNVTSACMLDCAPTALTSNLAPSCRS